MLDMCSSSVSLRPNMAVDRRREAIYAEHCAALGYFRAIEETQATLMVDPEQLALEGPIAPRKRMEFKYYPDTDEIYAKCTVINSGDYACAVNVSCQSEKAYTVKPGNAIVSAGQAHEIYVFMNFMDERKCYGRKVENDYFTVNLASLSAEHFEPSGFVNSYDRRILFASISEEAKDRLNLVARQKSWLPWKARPGQRRYIEMVLGAVLVSLILIFLNTDFCDCFARE